MQIKVVFQIIKLDVFVLHDTMKSKYSFFNKPQIQDKVQALIIYPSCCFYP